MYETTALPVPMNLDVPYIPAALENGILPIEFHNRPVAVTFRVWEGSMVGYIYQLRWNGMEAGPKKTILDHEKPGDPLTLEIPVALLTEGNHEVSYLVKNPFSLITNYSEQTPLIIDRTPPGKPALGPILFPDVIKDGLTSEELERLGDVLQGTIASYSGMKANDAVRTYWNDTPGPIAIVSEDDMGLKRVMVDFIKPFLESVGDGEASVYYTITDLAGNVSPDSIPAPVTLKLSYTPPLPTPTVKEAQGNVLDPAHATAGATVRIEALAQLRAGDRVTVQWQGPKGSDNQEKAITEADAGQPLELRFAYALVIANAGETVAIAYTVNRANGQVQTSDTLHLNIRAGLDSLPTPSMDTVGADGVVTPSRIPESGATVRVRYPGMSRDDRVIVSWRGASNHDTANQTVGASTELLFNVPKALIVASSGRTATVFYTVRRADNQAESVPLWLSVYQGLVLDTTPVTLDGKVYLLPGSPDLLPTLPAGTTVQRVARGGQAPYTYSSSDTLVAKVDGNGLVTVRGKGTASIQVSDSRGESLRYTVNVTGVIQCLGLGSGSFTTVSTAAANQGARLCSIEELREIHAAYGARWPMGNANYWSSTVAMTNLVGWKWYFVKNLVSGGEFKLLHHNASLGVAIR
ncbi:Ig-like domain-containing protein [Pseudomonas sp. 3A(2025)]